MLTRVLEPEVMDTIEEAIAYDTMDHRQVNARFAADFLATLAAAGRLNGTSGRILDLGTGTAQIPIELVRQARAQYPEARLEITAVDLAAEMLVVAKKNVAEAGYTDSIRLERLDAKTLPYPPGRFSAVMSNSIIHHIPEPLEALEEATRITAPGSLLFFRDLLRPETTDELNHLVSLYAAEANPEQRQLFAQSLHAALTVSEVQRLVERLGFDPAAVKQTSDRHWTWTGWKK